MIDKELWEGFKRMWPEELLRPTNPALAVNPGLISFLSGLHLTLVEFAAELLEDGIPEPYRSLGVYVCPVGALIAAASDQARAERGES